MEIFLNKILNNSKQISNSLSTIDKQSDLENIDKPKQQRYFLQKIHSINKELSDLQTNLSRVQQSKINMVSLQKSLIKADNDYHSFLQNKINRLNTDESELNKYISELRVSLENLIAVNNLDTSSQGGIPKIVNDIKEISNKSYLHTKNLIVDEILE